MPTSDELGKIEEALESYIEHPLIKPKTIEKRIYQEKIIASASKRNSLIVLPTGIGKTVIAMGVAAHVLINNPEGRILVMAPTKPLVNQHKKSFEKVFVDDKIKEAEVLTGAILPEEREGIYKKTQIVFATPQVIQNDLLSGKINLKDFALIIFDEAHRSIGNYAYTFIAKNYVENANKPLILGLTASPGGTKEKIGAICGNLFVENVEIRTEEDWDVKPYIKEVKIDWVSVELPKEFNEIQKCLKDAVEKKLRFLLKFHVISSLYVPKRRLLELQKALSAKAYATRDLILFKCVSVIAACIKLSYALELLESQGITQLNNYFEKLQKEKTKASRSLLSDADVKRAMILTKELKVDGIEHPKMKKVAEILKNELKEDEKAIVFTQYVNTVDLICFELQKQGLNAHRFIGQRKGLTQKNQLEILEQFRNGDFNIIVSTSVGEEGLDIPKVDLVIFYEPIPSEIRNIQRRGRTGRFKEGKIAILMAKKTIDEAYFWSSRRKESKMKHILHGLKDGLNNNGVEVREKIQKLAKKQSSLDRFSGNKEKVIIFSDSHEKSIIDSLKKEDIETRMKQLKVGDFIISERCGVERKTTADFLSSIVDGRLFKQAEELADNFESPILILEGKDLYSIRKIHPNAVKGAMASIMIDYHIPIIRTKSSLETAKVLASLARREQLGVKKDIAIRGEKKMKTLADMQEFIISGFPNINVKLSRRILNEFKTIKGFINANDEQLRKVEGIGREKAKKIKEIVDKEYKPEQN